MSNRFGQLSAYERSWLKTARKFNKLVRKKEHLKYGEYSQKTLMYLWKIKAAI